ncbi:MAG: tRNA preQ1(34) S-adenosylmethionine ribosyltransferase-isomerase QueA [Thermoplasmata archaeon]
MRVEDFDYSLPRGLIAQRPTAVRGDSRMMVLEDEIRHEMFSNLPKHMEKGDVLVLNDSKVLPARLRGRRETGGRVELLLLRKEGANWLCMGGGRMKEGESLRIGDSSAEVVERSGGRLLVRFDSPDFDAFLREHGEMPVPPYIKEELDDGERYQTVYARAKGSIAAPTAGLHFTHEMLEELSSKGVRTAMVTLHVGPGTFLPVKSRRAENHEMGEEYFEISEEAAQVVNDALDSDRRLFVVGTTTVRALESSQSGGRVAGSKGWTDLFIHPPYEFGLKTDALITNFHLPRSTVLMLVSAYAGRERILEAYEEAIRREYRFYSFGDAMLVFR